MSNKVICGMVAVLICLAGCDEAFEQVIGPSGVKQSDKMINHEGVIGGEPTGNTEWEGVIMVSAGGMCSGTLIHPEVVLSAGHCVLLNDPNTGQFSDATKNPGSLTIRGGAKGAITLAKGKEIIPHPTWTGELSAGAGDLSLILLDREVTSVPHYSLRDFPVPQDGDKGMLVGYGGNKNGWMTGAGTRRKGETTLLGVFSDVIETGQPTNTCQGDSGGPLFTQQNGEWVVTGVTSFGTSSDCNTEGGSYSVNLVAYCGWVDDTMKELVGEGLGLDKCSSCEAEKTAQWGQGCGEGYGPCPNGSTCRFPDDFSNGKFGFCAADCCRLAEVDAEYCSDVAGGEERCTFIDSSGDRFCAIKCENSDECPTDTVCKNKPFEVEKICIAVEAGDYVDSDVDADTDADTDSDADSDGDADGDSDGDADGDADGDSDGDADGDADGDSDSGMGSEDDTDEGAGCNCQLTGSPTLRNSPLLSIVRTVLF